MQPTGTHVVVLDRWPPAEVGAAAGAWAALRGGTALDHAQRLRICHGIAAQRMAAEAAQQLAAALTEAGVRAWACDGAMLPPLPKPRVASRLVPGPDGVQAQIALTGPPAEIPWPQIVSVLPARKDTVATITARKANKGVSAATAAMALTTGIGAVKVLKAVRGKTEATAAVTQTSSRLLVELVAAGPWRRVQGYADRLDYSVLGEEMAQGSDNFPALLRHLQSATRPHLASAPILGRYLTTGTLPAQLHVEDDNALARITRWLLLRRAVAKLQS